MNEFLKRERQVNAVLAWCIAIDLEWQWQGHKEDERFRSIRYLDKNAEPEFRDFPEWEPKLVGSSGWNPEDKESVWGGADIDGLNHGESGLTQERIQAIIIACAVVSWLQIQKSKSGDGIHLLWRWSTENRPKAMTRAEHRRNCLRVVRLIEILAGLKLINGDVDCAGLILWLWSAERNENSFKVIQTAKGFVPDDLPKIGVQPKPADYQHVELTDRHKADVAVLQTSACPPRYVPEKGCWAVHTITLRLIDPGFETSSAGTDPSQPNAFMFPQSDGSWTVYRFNGAKEHESWNHGDRQTWTTINTRSFDYSWNAPADAYAPTPIGELVRRHPKRRPPLIDGLIRRGDVMNIIAAPKVGKSWLTYHLALSIADGRDWHGFSCRRGRVLLLDNELHREEIADRIPKVAEAMGVTDYQDRITVVSMRGHLLDLNAIGQKIISKIERGQYDLVILDAWYRANPGGSAGENDNSAVANSFNLVDQFAAKMGAAWALIHHTSKGDQSQKSITDTGAGAGSQSRAADCHLVLRAHEHEGHVVLDAVVRSFAPIEPLVLKWEFPLFSIADGMDPTALHQPKQAKQRAADTHAQPHLLSLLKEQPDSITRLAERAKMGHARVSRLVKDMLDGGLVELQSEDRRGNRSKVYRLVENPNLNA
jgi:hypothetical protein